jgi:hypothetical protein
MEYANFAGFIREHDNDKIAIKKAVLEYHSWLLLPPAAEN